MYLFFDDLFRKDFVPAKKLFYRTLKTIFSGINITFRNYERYDPLENETFKRLNRLSQRSLWQDTYFELPNDYKAVLSDYLSGSPTVLSYEMSPGLKSFLIEQNLNYIDVRLSPIRFCEDLLICLNSNIPSFNERLANIAVKESGARCRASQIRESLNHLKQSNWSALEKYRDSTIFLGQTEADASLLSENKNGFLSIGDFQEKFKDLKHERVFYKPHPASGKSHQQRETDFLRENCAFMGASTDPTYSLFASEIPMSFLAISSGAVTEAEYFDKKSQHLFKPICDIHSSEYPQLTGHNFLSPDIWAYLLSKIEMDELQKRLIAATTIPDQFRNIHNAFWGYLDLKAEMDQSTTKLLEIAAQNRLTQIDDRLDRMTSYLKNPFLYFSKKLQRKTLLK